MIGTHVTTVYRRRISPQFTMAATRHLFFLLLHLTLIPSVLSMTLRTGARNHLPRPSVETCAAALLPPTNSLAKPDHLDAAQYINLQAPINCSGNLTGYYYYYLCDGDPVVEGTISMWVPVVGGASFRQVEDSQYMIDGFQRHRSGRRRRSKRMSNNNSQPMDNEVNLPMPIPVVRGSVVAVNIASNNDRDGHYIVDTGRESDRLCQLPTSTNYMTNCSASRSRLVLLVQPLVSAINCEPPDPPSNGSVSGSQHQYGDTVTYTCHEGFILVGDSYQTCQANSTWSGSAPKCILASPSPTVLLTKIGTSSALVIVATEAPDEVNHRSYPALSIVGSVVSILVFVAIIAVICLLVIVWKRRRQPIQLGGNKSFTEGTTTTHHVFPILGRESNTQEAHEPSVSDIHTQTNAAYGSMAPVCIKANASYGILPVCTQINASYGILPECTQTNILPVCTQTNTSYGILPVHTQTNASYNMLPLRTQANAAYGILPASDDVYSYVPVTTSAPQPTPATKPVVTQCHPLSLS